MDYSAFRNFADSWGLLYLFILFLGIVLFTFRPGSRRQADENSKIPFVGDDENV